MEFTVLILLLVGFWSLQYFLSYGQTRNYNHVIREVSQHGTGFLGVGLARTKFNLGPGTVVILAVDVNGNIIDYREMHGYSVFNRFKIKSSYIGSQLSDVDTTRFKKTQKKAYEQALSLINDERSKQDLSSMTPLT